MVFTYIDTPPSIRIQQIHISYSEIAMDYQISKISTNNIQ